MKGEKPKMTKDGFALTFGFIYLIIVLTLHAFFLFPFAFLLFLLTIGIAIICGLTAEEVPVQRKNDRQD